MQNHHPSGRPSAHPSQKGTVQIQQQQQQQQQVFPVNQNQPKQSYQPFNAQIQNNQQYQQYGNSQQDVLNGLRNEINGLKSKFDKKDRENKDNLSSIITLKQNHNNEISRYDKQLEDLRFELTSLRSDKLNYKEMKADLEDEIEQMKRQRSEQLEIHQKEVQTLRERQKTLVEDLQEQRRKYDHLHFYLERNAKQFEFEEGQLKSQLKVKDQEISSLEKQMQTPGIAVQNKDAMSNLVAENESLRQRLSEMARQLANYSDMEKRLNENAMDKREFDIQQIEQKLRIDQEKIIRQRTMEVEAQLTRVTQDLQFSRKNEQLLQAENVDLKEKSKKMIDAVNEKVKMWKEKYEQASYGQGGSGGGSQEIMHLRQELQIRDRRINEQESQLFKVTSEMASLKRDYSSNRPSMNVMVDNQQVQDLQRQSNQQQDLINQLSEQLEDTRKKSSKNAHNINYNVSSGNEQELLERNRRLEATNRQLSEAVADLETKVSKYGEQPAKIGQSYSQRGTATGQYIQTSQVTASYPAITVSPPGIPQYQYTFNNIGDNYQSSINRPSDGYQVQKVTYTNY